MDRFTWKSRDLTNQKCGLILTNHDLSNTMMIWGWVKTLNTKILDGGEHPFTNYVDIRQGYKALTHTPFNDKK